MNGHIPSSKTSVPSLFLPIGVLKDLAHNYLLPSPIKASTSAGRHPVPSLHLTPIIQKAHKDLSQTPILPIKKKRHFVAGAFPGTLCSQDPSGLHICTLNACVLYPHGMPFGPVSYGYLW
jgi:hypothetical protein